jgi:hypothetical protein
MGVNHPFRDITDSHIDPMTSQLHIFPVFLPTLYPIIVGCVPSIPPFDLQPQDMSNPEALQCFLVPSCSSTVRELENHHIFNRQII